MLRFVSPSVKDLPHLLLYRREILLYDRDFEGTAGMGHFPGLHDWLHRLSLLEPEQARRRGYTPTVVFLAYEKNTLAGMGNVRLSEDAFQLCGSGNIGYHVRPSLRRMGYGRQLLAHARQLCLDNGLLHPTVCIRPDNLPSIRMVLACGWTEDRTDTLPSGETVLRFCFSPGSLTGPDTEKQAGGPVFRRSP